MMKTRRWPALILLALVALLLSGAKRTPPPAKLTVPQKTALSLASGTVFEGLARTNPMLLIRLNSR